MFLKRRTCRLLFRRAIAIGIFLTLLVPGSANRAYAAAPSACRPGESVVLHATYGAYDDVTIAFDTESIQETYSSLGLDYGLTVGANERGAWRVDENGVTSTNAGDAKRDFMTLRAALCNDLTPATAQGATERGAALGGWPVSIQRDPATGAISRIDYSESGSVQNIQIFGYRMLQTGAMVPTSWRVDNGQVVMVSRQEIVERPSRSATPGWPATAAVIRVGTFALRTAGGRFTLDGRLAGAPIGCMIDTGANNFAVSADLAGVLERRDSSQAGTHLVGGNVVTRVGRVSALEVAGSTFSKPVVYVDSRLPTRTVLCGADYLAKIHLRLDIAGQRATISAGRGEKCSVGCVPIGEAGIASGQATIGGREFNVLFDSGYAGAIRLPPQELSTIKYGVQRSYTGYCATDPVRVDLSLGGVASSSWACPLLVDSRIPIAIGAEAFAAYSSVVIDYPDHFLQFTK